MDDTRKDRRIVEGGRRGQALHPELLPATQTLTGRAAHYMSLEHLIVRDDEHPLRASAGGVEERKADVRDGKPGHGCDGKNDVKGDQRMGRRR